MKITTSTILLQQALNFRSKQCTTPRIRCEGHLKIRNDRHVIPFPFHSLSYETLRNGPFYHGARARMTSVVDEP